MQAEVFTSAFFFFLKFCTLEFKTLIFITLLTICAGASYNNHY